MATNPMQRKAKNAFIGGVATMLLISILIGALGVYKYIQLNDELETLLVNKTAAYVLKQDVKSGSIITSDMFEKRTDLDKRTIPADAISMANLDDYSLTDQEGNEIGTIDLKDQRISDNGQTIELKYDEDTGKYYRMLNNQRVNTEYVGYYLVKNEQTALILQEETTERYYIYNNGNKEYVEFNNVPIIAKIDMNANTILTPGMIARSNEIITADIREQQYNMLVLPQNLEVDNYIDIRIMLPNGQDYIVVSKKRVKNANAETIWIDMSEAEILLMSNAIVENYVTTGSKLYATIYVEPGNQTQAQLTYIPSYEVTTLIQKDSNIINKAKDELVNRYLNNADIRGQIQNQLNQHSDEAQSNIETKVQEEITKSEEARKQYIEEMGM